MERWERTFRRRIEAARLRVRSLKLLRKLVSLPPEYDITKRQWSVIESQLASVETRLQSRLDRAEKSHIGELRNTKTVRSLNSLLGEIELEMTSTFTFFDTYVDILTQRKSPELGPLLAGCDVLAWDALHRNHPALTTLEPPLVYCDRGFGASILREGVLMPDKTPNPIPLIQIPYSRLREKYNLTSILHEAGHQALIRLGLKTPLANALRTAVKRTGGDDSLADLFALWSCEIGPDFWAFCLSGIAQAAGLRDILSLPPSHVYRVSGTDPHPPPYLRVLLAFACCRQVWGRGAWDQWENDWRELYPLESASSKTVETLREGVSVLPAVADALLSTRFPELSGKRISDFFDFGPLTPAKLTQRANGVSDGILDLKGLSPSIQLAVFRLVRDQESIGEEVINATMIRWLISLARTRNAIALN